MAKRLQAMGQPNYANGFKLTMQPKMLNLPLTWKTPQVIFVNSMSDLFHKDVTTDYILKVFEVMGQASQHVFQVLTKRSNRLMRLSSQLPWAPNIWMGVSVESSAYTFRIDHLRETGAHVKFLSLEPLLGSLHKMNLLDIDWAIVGGESGPGARAMQAEWVVDIRDQCLAAGVPFFFKQWGGTRKKTTGRLLEGRTWDQMPTTVAA
jgi:protein gp37